MAQHIGGPIRLVGAAAVLVHHLVADGVKHHVLRPFEGWMLRLVLQSLIVGVCRQIGVGISVLGILGGGLVGSGIRIQTPGCRLPFGLRLSALRGIIGRFYGCLVVVAVFFQPFDIRPFISVISVRVLLAIDQSGVDPAMHHIVHGLSGAGFVIALQAVDEAAVCDSQRHVSRRGLNLAHAHIAAVCRLGQIDAFLGAGVDLGAVAIRGIDEIRSGDLDCLRVRANAAVHTGQGNAPALDGGTSPRLGDVARRIQRHVPKGRVRRKSGVSALALEFDDFHVAGQGLVRQQSAHGGDVDVPLVVGNGGELDIVIHRGDIAVRVFGRRADGSEMDILDIVLRRQVHDLTLQERVVKLRNAARLGTNRQRSLVVGVRHVARQVDVAARVVSALDVNLAHFRADQTDGDVLGSADGVIVSLEDFFAFLPTGIVVPEPAEESRLFQRRYRRGGVVRQAIGSGIKAQVIFA